MCFAWNKRAHSLNIAAACGPNATQCFFLRRFFRFSPALPDANTTKFAQPIYTHMRRQKVLQVNLLFYWPTLCGEQRINFHCQKFFLTISQTCSFKVLMHNFYLASRSGNFNEISLHLTGWLHTASGAGSCCKNSRRAN